MKAPARQGFTLVEMSIVLVIIGLIVGGIFTGRDLISAAGMRATIGQIEGYNSAVHAFKAKYGAIPGDLRAAQASALGFASRDGTSGSGNGDGYLGSNEANSIGFFPVFELYLGRKMEPKLFWADLSSAKLINGSFPAGEICNTWGSSAGVSKCLPLARIGRSSYVYAWPYDGDNYFEISGIAGSDSDPYTPGAFPAVFTVQEAYNIDAKIDDGLPETGLVLAARFGFVPLSGIVSSSVLNPWIQGDNGPNDHTYIPPGPTNCYDTRSFSMQQYSTEVNSGDALNCVLAFKFQ